MNKKIVIMTIRFSGFDRQRLFHSFTVNSEIFAMALLSRNLARAKFCENKTLAKLQNNSAVLLI